MSIIIITSTKDVVICWRLSICRSECVVVCIGHKQFLKNLKITHHWTDLIWIESTCLTGKIWKINRGNPIWDFF